MAKDNAIKARLLERVKEADLTLSLKDIDDDKLHWARANRDYAEALGALAEEEQEPEAYRYYQLAIEAFEKNLEIYNKKVDLPLWSGTVIELCRILRSYGQREGGQLGFLRLQRASVLLQEVEDYLSDKASDFDYALLHIEKSYVQEGLASLALGEKKCSYLQASLAYLSKALNLLKKKERFDQWAAVLCVMGIRFRELGRLQEKLSAVHSYNKSIRCFSSAQAYYETVFLEGNGANVEDFLQCLLEQSRTYIFLSHLVKKKQRYKILLKAHNIFRKIGEDFSSLPEISKYNQEKLQTRWAEILSLLAQVSPIDEAYNFWQKAITLNRKSAKLLRKQDDLLNYALVMGHLGKDYSLCSHVVLGRKKIYYWKLAVKALEQAVPDLLCSVFPIEWLANLIELGASYHVLAGVVPLEKQYYYYERAYFCYEKALKSLSKQEDSLLWGRLHNWLAVIHCSLADIESEKEQFHYEEALKHVKESLSSFPLSQFSDHIQLKMSIAHIYHKMGALAEDTDAKMALTYYKHAEEVEKYCWDHMGESSMALDTIRIGLQLSQTYLKIATLEPEKEDYYFLSENILFSSLDLINKDNSWLYLQLKNQEADLYLHWYNWRKSAKKSSKLLEEMARKVCLAFDFLLSQTPRDIFLLDKKHLEKKYQEFLLSQRPFRGFHSLVKFWYNKIYSSLLDYVKLYKKYRSRK